MNRWLPVQAALGAVLALLVELPLSAAASAVLLPLAGVFVGLTFAWAGNAIALLQTSEIDDLASRRQGGFPEYVFAFQLAILVLLTSLVLWGIAGLGVFDRSCPWDCSPWVYTAAEAVVYTVSAIALRECWHVVLGAQWMLLAQRHIKRIREPQLSSKEPNGRPPTGV